MISNRHNSFESVVDDRAREAIDELAPGCFVLVTELPNGQIEALVLHKFKGAISTMVVKEPLYSLHMRYLTHEERIIARENTD
jgi:hypothetical protein